MCKREGKGFLFLFERGRGGERERERERGGGCISGLAFFLAKMISYNYGSASRRALSRAQGIQRPSVRR